MARITVEGDASYRGFNYFSPHQSVAVRAADPRVVVGVLARHGKGEVGRPVRDVEEGGQGREGLRAALDQRGEAHDEQLHRAEQSTRSAWEGRNLGISQD